MGFSFADVSDSWTLVQTRTTGFGLIEVFPHTLDFGFDDCAEPDDGADEEYEDDFEPLSLASRSAARKSTSVLVDGGFLEGRTTEYRSLYSFSHC